MENTIHEAMVNDFKKSLEDHSNESYTDFLEEIDPIATKLFGRGASAYERKHLKRLKFSQRYIKSIFEENSPSKIVDLGATWYSVPLLRSVFKDSHLCLSLSDDEITEIMNLKIPNVSAFGIDLEKQVVPVESDSADLVLLLEVIEHFYIDPMFCLFEANRVLKNGGKIFITTPNICSWRAMTAILTNYGPYLYGRFSGPGSRRHVHEFAPRDVYALLDAAGFEPTISTENFSSNQTGESIIKLLSDAGCPTDHRGDSIIAIGTKIGAPRRRHPEEIYDIY